MTVDQALQLARQHHSAGRLREAEPLYRQVLAADPGHAEALNLLGLIALQCGQPKPAIDLMERSVALNGAVFYYFNNLGEAYKAVGRYDDAAGAFERSLALRPNAPDTLHSLAVALERAGHVDRATDVLRQTLVIAPKLATAHLSLGAILEQQARYDEAMDHFEQAVAARPDYARARAARAAIWLRRGDYARGWEEYEWRWRVERFPGRPPRPGVPVWDGAPLEGRTILLTAEQGLGDVIQFVRYAPMVAARGGRVIVECPAPLVRLLRTVEGVSDVVESAEGLAFDVQLPLLSLPRVFGTRLETVPATLPYVRATEAGAWRERIPDDGVYKVGICWAGGQKQAHRWIPPAQIDRLTAGVPGVRFYSLQKEMPAGDGARPAGLIDFMPEVGDFADTAGLVDALDRVITVDTSVAHVAGALAKRMWVAVPRQVDWRWLTGRADSPWYPTATLFRQETFGDWSAVVDRMAEALRDEVASRRRGQ